MGVTAIGSGQRGENDESPAADGPQAPRRRRLLQALAAGLATPASLHADFGPESVLYRPIPSTGEQLPVVGLSASRVFDVGPDPLIRAGPSGAIGALRALPNALLETSPLDGRAETVVGEVLATTRHRKNVFLASKVWTTGRDAAIRQMRETLRALQTDHIDLMQIHNLVGWRANLRTLRAWKDVGLIRYIGITHYHRAALPLMLSIVEREPIDFLQINYSITESSAERQLLPMAQNRKVAVIASHPFGDGRLLRRLRGLPIPAWARRQGIDNWTAFLLKFVLTHPAVTCTLAGATNASQVNTNLSGGFGPLPGPELRRRMASYVNSL